MARTEVNMGTYMKIKDFLKKNPDKEFSPTEIRDEMNSDYYSVKLVVEMLKKEKIITRTKEGKYKYEVQK